jgi:hypothetical protein
MGANFRRLSTGASPLVVPRVKLGHTTEQALAKWLQSSEGFPSLGRIYGLSVSGEGLCAFDLEIPTQIGALVNGGWYVDGSIEIAPPLPDPEDAATKLYPVLTAISLLGEEQPAVPLRYPMPRAVFADGTEVPAETDLTPLAQAMAEVAKSFSAGHRAKPTTGKFAFNGQTFTTAVVCFSAMTPLQQGTSTMPFTPEQKAAFAAAPFSYSAEQIDDMEKKMAAVPPNPAPAPAPPPEPAPGPKMTDPPKDGEDPIAAMSAKMSADPAAPQYAKDMMSAFAAFAASCNKRFSATEAAVQKTEGDAKMAASFSAEYKARIEADHKKRVEAVVDQAVLDGRIERRDRDMHVAHGEKQSDTVTFAAGTAHAGKTAFAVWADDIRARKPSKFFRDDVTQTTPDNPTAPGDDPFVRAALATLPGNRAPAYAPATK